MKTQKKREHYFKKRYNTLERFISYFYQIDLVRELYDADLRINADAADRGCDENQQSAVSAYNPQHQHHNFKVLEIGKGNGLVSDYLKKLGYRVVTADIDPELEPDYVADVRALPFEDNSFEVVTAFEVLEHVLFEDLPRALGELKRVSSRFVVVSLPYRSSSFEFTIRFPLIRTILKKDFLRFFVRIPWFFKGFQSSGQHYWEIDGYNYRLGKVKKILKKHFTKVKIIRPVLDGYRLFFILQK